MKRAYIKTIELHFSNKCTGNCVICSEAHGGDNPQFCTTEVVDKIVENLKNVDFHVLQVGGDGDSFLNRDVFFYGLRKFRENFPNKTICLYTNGSLLIDENVDVLVKERLLDEMVTRIDSLNPILYKQSTGLNLEKVLDNFKYLFSINDFIRCDIVYFPLHKYRGLCNSILDREPAKWKRIDESLLTDEWSTMRTYFKSLPKLDTNKFRIRPSQISFWGERKDAPPRYVECFQRTADEFAKYLKRGFLLPDELCCHGSFINQTYIYPNGSMGVCPYDDAQNTFILGNIMNGEDTINSMWFSDKRAQIIQDIRDGKYTGKYPCVDPYACGMYDVP